MTEKTQVQRRYTLTIPRTIRETLGISEGTEVIWEVEGARIVITPRTFNVFRDRFRGRPRYNTEQDEDDVEKAFLSEAQRDL